MGPERAARMSPARSAGARDIPYTVHADTPIVPMEPMRMIWSTVNRVTTSGDNAGAPHQTGHFYFSSVSKRSADFADIRWYSDDNGQPVDWRCR